MELGLKDQRWSGLWDLIPDLLWMIEILPGLKYQKLETKDSTGYTESWRIYYPPAPSTITVHIHTVVTPQGPGGYYRAAWSFHRKGP